MKEMLPNFFMNQLEKQYSDDVIEKIANGLACSRNVTIRVNTIKSNVEKVIQILKENEIEFERVPWFDSAIIVKNAKESDLQSMEIYENGEIYLQSLSSMLPPIILDPKQDEDILDMCSAPRRKNMRDCSFNFKYGTYYSM